MNHRKYFLEPTLLNERHRQHHMHNPGFGLRIPRLCLNVPAFMKGDQFLKWKMGIFCKEFIVEFIHGQFNIELQMLFPIALCIAVLVQVIVVLDQSVNL